MSRPPLVERTARRLLGHVEAWYADRAGDGATDELRVEGAQPLPDRRFVAGGAPREVAWDCAEGQVTVALERIILGSNVQNAPSPTQSPRRSGGALLIRQAVLEVQIVRRAPGLTGGGLPGRAALDEHGGWLMTDAAMLAAALTDATVSGVFAEPTPGLPDYARQVLLGDLVALGPQGDLSAISHTVTLTVY